MPRAHDNVPVGPEVANDHRAVGHARERAVTAVDGQPAGASHRRVAVAPMASEAAAAVASPEPADLARPRCRCSTRPRSVRRPAAAREAAAAQVHVHASARLARLANREHATAEDSCLNAAAAALGPQVDLAPARVECHAHRKLSALVEVLPVASGRLVADGCRRRRPRPSRRTRARAACSPPAPASCREAAPARGAPGPP